MMRLEEQQRGLLDLLKRRGVTPKDAYLQIVAESRELAVMQEIAVWWRVFQIEAQCRFTSRLLKRLGCFQETVLAYFNNHQTSPFVEELSRNFLDSLRAHSDSLVRVVAQFERALLEVRAGNSEQFELFWDRNPVSVFRALDSGEEIPNFEPNWTYRLRIAHDLPGLLACTREMASPRDSS